MSGKKSRSKGYRAENNLVKELRKQGFETFRVPLSGASLGYKGDIVIKHDSKEVVGEVKCRRDEFKSIYAMYDRYCGLHKCVIFNVDRMGILVTKSFQELGFYRSVEARLVVTDYARQDDKKAAKKLAGLSKYVKSCHFLAIKVDNKPYLFIRYIV